jgi:hypothetical protein
VSVTAQPAGPGARTGRLVVTGSGGTTAVAALQVTGVVTPVLVVNPGLGEPNTVAIATGQNFPPNITVQLAWDGATPAATATTDATGTFQVPVMIWRWLNAGTRKLVAQGQPGQFSDVSTPFLILAATVRPPGGGQPGFPGSALIVRG